MTYGPRLRHGEYVGGKESPEHYIWRSLFHRNKDISYVNVKVCERWHKFENFLEDMGRRPSPDLQIDRIDTYGDYEPSNCRWVTRSVQQKNKTTTKRWTWAGKTKTLTEWANYLGISKQLARYRINTWGTFIKGEVFHDARRKS